MDADPLAERDCMLSVVDPKGKGENKFRYVVVTQDEELVCPHALTEFLAGIVG